MTPSKKTITSRAPTRIDLAGGTVDIWPLYLFLKNPVTVNLGIDLFAEARGEVEHGASKCSILLKSEEKGNEMSLSWQDLFQENPQIHPALQLHFKLLRYFS